MVESDKLNQIFELSDGRSLGYAEYGDLTGTPIFHFHGHPGSRLEAILLGDAPKELGIRIIAVDRPGIGLSDYKPKRKLLDWPNDVIELADYLSLDKFAVQGTSGGGPYSLVCAYSIADRLYSCGVTAGVGPMNLSKKGMMRSNKLGVFIARWLPFLLKMMYKPYMKALNDPEKAQKLMDKLSEKLPEPDKKIIQDPQIKQLFIEESKEAFRYGTDGVILDEKIYSRHWGFNLEDISPDIPVHIWHGGLDVNVPISMGREMCRIIPNCKGHFIPNEAHISLALNYNKEIFNTLK